ncbi:MAG: hypoxanthine phosphoribosyltransferase [Bacteroidetes bacterium]|nr:MAG: hypoxanthine phosphoribosyltransferase [Bacteroidota bacterium]
MKEIQLKDKRFAIEISGEEILKQVRRVANEINKDLEGKKPLFLVVLNGAFMFASDLMKNIAIDCEISFVKLSSYQGTQSTEKVKELIGLNEDLQGRTVVIVEDIVDTGITMEGIIADLHKKRVAETRVATLLFKPQAFQKSYKVDYIGMEIPNDFIVGYGLDYDGLGRNFEDIYKIIDN